MKLAVIAVGHHDNNFPVMKRIAGEVDLTLVMHVAKNPYRESFLEISLDDVPFGFTDLRNERPDLLPGRFWEYLADAPPFPLYLFRSPSHRILDLRNQFYNQLFARWLRRGRFDLIHFNGVSGHQVPLYMGTPRIPKIHTIHDYDEHFGVRPRLSHSLFRTYVTRHARIIVQHGEALRRRVIELSGRPEESVVSLLNGANETFRLFEPENPPGEEFPTVLQWGRVDRYKGVELLLDAIPGVLREVPEARFIIGGAGRIDRDLSRWEKHPNVEIHNRYLGNEEIITFLHRSSLVAAPYLDATQSAVALTAFEFGKPLVASRVGTFPELVRDGYNGRLIPPGDGQALRKVLIEILKDRDGLRRMQANVAKRCREDDMNWDSVAERNLQMYRRAIES